MNQAIRDRWVRALRHGDYKQGRDTLVDDKDRFCCLGVLSDLFARAKGMGWTPSSGLCHRYFVDGDETENITSIPACVRVWAGLGDDENPNVRIGGESDAEFGLIACNDDIKMSFEGIADAIERSL